jgi:hypothetical protein
VLHASGRRFLCLLSFRRDKKKVRRRAGRSARGFLPPQNLLIPSKSKTNSPVPAGSRVTFFTGLKKVTKERTYHWRGALFCQSPGAINDVAADYGRMLIGTGRKRGLFAMVLLRQYPHRQCSPRFE